MDIVRYEVHGRAVWIHQPRTAHFSRKAVIVLHGSYESPEGVAKASAFDEVAARSRPGFLVVYPEMQTPGGDTWGFDAPWEESFFRDVCELLSRDFGRDEVYVVGHSNGGSMSLFLQNKMPDLFKAAAAVEAGVNHLEMWNNASWGLPTIVVWNHNDPVLGEFGGEQLYQSTIDTLTRGSAAYNAGAARVLPLPSGYQGVVSAERHLWNNVKKHRRFEVVSWASEQPTHDWVNNQNLLGAPLDASILVWDFFQSV